MVCGCTGKLQIENNRGWYFTPSSVYLVGTVLLSAYEIETFYANIKKDISTYYDNEILGEEIIKRIKEEN